MFIKLIGSVVVVFATSKIGFDLAAGLERRIEQLRSALVCLAALEGEITFKNTPLGVALCNVGGGDSGAIGEIFVSAGEKLKTKSGMRAKEVWEQSLAEAPQALALTNEDVGILKAFGGLLGSLDIDAQRSNIAMTRKNLDYAYEEALASKERYGKMYRSVGILAGIFIVILFI